MIRNVGPIAAGAVLAVWGLAAPHAGARADDGATSDALDDELLASIQGMLAVQRLDGWLLYDDAGRNPIARELVGVRGDPAHRWFYFIPSLGEPVAIAGEDDLSRFADAPGREAAYAGHDALEATLARELEGAERLAMEHAPDSGIPSLSRVDAGTIDLVRGLGAEVRSSADLVQHTLARWRSDGRIAHYVAVHHLVALRDEALSLVARRVRAGETITERDVQRALVEGYELRGLEGPPPRVAIDAHAANPEYVPTDERSAPIRAGDLLLLDLAARVADAPRPIYADMSWVAFVGDEVPDRYRELFEVAARARDAAIALIRERVEAGRPVRGYEAARAVRDVVRAAGHEGAYVHRAGHSLGVDLPGPGANLEDGDVRDARPLVPGTGFAIGPGLYLRGDIGVRAQVGAHIRGRQLEITGPVQRRITPLGAL